MQSESNYLKNSPSRKGIPENAKIVRLVMVEILQNRGSLSRQTDRYARLDLLTESTFFVYYQGGPPSAHATPIRLPNGQLVTHKRKYFDNVIENHSNVMINDFLEGNHNYARQVSVWFQNVSVTCSRQFDYHE